MKCQKLSHMISVVALALLLFAGTVFAQSARKIDYQRMQKDLDITETILGKLLNSDSRFRAAAAEPIGIYFEGYGVIFHIDKKNEFFSVIQMENIKQLRESLIKLKRQQVEADDEDVVVVAPQSDLVVKREGTAAAAETAQRRIARLQESIVEFLGDYADAIGQLRDNDRITVLVDLNGHDGRVWAPEADAPEGETENIAVLEMSAVKKDIVAYRRGKIDAAAFRKRIAVTEKDENQAVNKHIEIMADILNTALGGKYQKDVRLSEEPRGVYLQGLGAVFFLQGRFHGPFTAMKEYIETVNEYIDEQGVRAVKTTGPEKRRQKKRPSRQELLDHFKRNLTEVLGNYGHTLRTLAPEEYIVVAVDFDSFLSLPDNTAERFVAKVKKRDLDRYNGGALSFAGFEKRVQFQSY